MSYRLEYSIGGVRAVSKNEDPKQLRLLIKQIEKSKEDVSWKLINDGGIVLSSSDEEGA